MKQKVQQKVLLKELNPFLMLNRFQVLGEKKKTSCSHKLSPKD